MTKSIIMLLLSLLVNTSTLYAQSNTEPVPQASDSLKTEGVLSAENKAALEKEKAQQEAERIERERKKKEELARQQAAQKVGEKSKDFVPTEEISEDQPVPFPVDI